MTHENNIDEIILQLRSEIIQLKQTLRTSRVLGNSLYVGDNTILTKLLDGNSIFVDSKSLDVGYHIVNGGKWEPRYVEYFRSIIEETDTILDVGANHGVYALAAAQKATEGKVYAFEANPRLAKLVKMSAIINAYQDRLTILNGAVGHINGVADLSFEEGFSGGASLFDKHVPSSTRRTERVPVSLIDDLIPNLVSVDVMKMDIEGYEGCALAGMSRILQSSPNIKIIMEWSRTMMNGSPIGSAQTARILEDFELRPWRMLSSGSFEATDWITLGNTSFPVQNIYVARAPPV